MHKELTERFIRYAKKQDLTKQVKQSQQRHLKQRF